MKTIKIMMMALMMCLVFTSCSSTEEKLQEAIKIYVQSNWNDADTYEPISFSDLDTSFVCSECSEILKEKTQNSSNIDSSSECLKLITEILNSSETLEQSKEKRDSLEKRRDYFMELYDKNSKDLDEKYKKAKEKNNNSEINGYAVTHKLRIKNKKGVSQVQEWRFFFDKNLVVTDAYRVDYSYEEVIEDALKEAEKIERDIKINLNNIKNPY